MRLKYDPIEKTEEFKEAMKDIEVLSFFRFFFHRRHPGLCHSKWAFKKKMLKKWYNIDWKTPQEMNPDVRFD